VKALSQSKFCNLFISLVKTVVAYSFGWCGERNGEHFHIYLGFRGFFDLRNDLNMKKGLHPPP
jgi:hypothetical protein